MNKTQHRSNNLVLGAPKDWDHKVLPCEALPVTKLESENAMVSFWRPTAEELARLNAGDLVALWVYGGSHPPVAVTVEET